MPTYALSSVATLPLPLPDDANDEGLRVQHEKDELEAYQAHEKYRITQDVIGKVNQLLAKYTGAHYYHNFTSGKWVQHALFEQIFA